MSDDLKKLAEKVEAAEGATAYVARLNLHSACTPAAILALIRERDEARKQVNGLRLSQSLDKDSAYVIRELLNRHNVPAAAFVDDHVANAIAQRDAAEAALSAAQEEVGRVQRWLSYVERELVAAMERGQLHHSLHVLVTGTQDPTDR